jgi:outer membrane protein assembly factor BamD
MMNFQRLLAAALAAALVLSGAACSHGKKDDAFVGPEKSDRELRAEAAALYALARKSLDQSDFSEAVGRYDMLSKRYPFTEYATQGEIEAIYALYRSYDSEKALSAADRFLREHPRNASIDYVQYIRGLVNFNRDPSFSSMFGVSGSKGDVTNYRRSFDDFALLLQKYPSSRYAGDARQRMIYLRNVIAEHELGVVEFYTSRGAYLAAAKRAEQIIAQYPGAPATYRALELMEQSYRRAGLQQQAEDAARLLAAQPSEASLKNVSAPQEEGPSWLDRLLKRDAATSDAPAPPAASATP